MNSNYADKGGSVFVIGGELKFLPGSKVTGLDLGNKTIPPIADSKATTLAVLRDEFNHLLQALRDAGIMAGDAE